MELAKKMLLATHPWHQRTSRQSKVQVKDHRAQMAERTPSLELDSCRGDHCRAP